MQIAVHGGEQEQSTISYRVVVLRDIVYLYHVPHYPDIWMVTIKDIQTV